MTSSWFVPISGLIGRHESRRLLSAVRNRQHGAGATTGHQGSQSHEITAWPVFCVMSEMLCTRSQPMSADFAHATSCKSRVLTVVTCYAFYHQQEGWGEEGHFDDDYGAALKVLSQGLLGKEIHETLFCTWFHLSNVIFKNCPIPYIPW